MPKSRRLLFNFGDIFNDHRKLCYLFVDVASFKTVKDFKIHVQLGFNIEEPIFFSDNDNILFPDFDDIRSLIDFPEVIWVRKLENHPNLYAPESNVPASVNNSSCNFRNDSALISFSDSFIGQDEVSFTKSRKDKRIKKKRKKDVIENDCEIYITNTLEGNNKNSSIGSLDLIHETETNDRVSCKKSSTCKVNNKIKRDGEKVIVSCDNFDKDSSDPDHDPEVIAQNTGKLNSYRNESFNSTNNDLIVKPFNENINHSGSPMNESVSLHDTNGEKTYEINRLSFFGKNHSVSNNSLLLEEDDLLSESVVRKVKRKRKRNRKRKKLESKEVSFINKDDDQGRNGVETKIFARKVSNSMQKHIRFESDNELDDMVKDNGHLSSTESSEPAINESSAEFDKRVISDSVSVTKTEENEFSVMNEVSENISKNIVNNSMESEKIQNSNCYQNGKFDLHRENNIGKMLTKNWDRKDESSEVICGELLKLKEMVKKTSYFNPPVFNRTPKVSLNSKNAVQKPPETSKNNFSVSNGSSMDQSVNTGSEHRNTVDDVSLIVDDIVNFKILFLSADYTPTISDNVMGRVISVTDEVIKFKILLGLDICKPLTGKFSLTKEDGNEDCDIVELNMEDLINPKKIINPFSVLNQ